MTLPKIGDRFFHARVLDPMKMPAREPQLYQVTQLARGMIYYRPVYDYGTRQTLGKPECCRREQWSNVRLAQLSDGSNASPDSASTTRPEASTANVKATSNVAPSNDTERKHSSH